MRSDATTATIIQPPPASVTVARPAWLPQAMWPGYLAARQNLRPFIAIQMCAFAILIAYTFSPSFRAFCMTLADMKEASGLVGAGFIAAVAGAIIPEIAKTLAMGERHFSRARISRIAFAMPIFFFSGCTVDLFYRWQAILFGTQTDLLTSIKKVLFDQFVYTVIWAIPFMTIMFRWHANGLRFDPTWRELNDRFITRRILPVLLPAWTFWIPMTLILYLLPVSLQYLMFVFALGAWSLILTFVTTESEMPG